MLRPIDKSKAELLSVDFAEAEQLVSTALPDLKCLVCDTADFEVHEMYADELRTVLNFHADQDPIAKKYSGLLSLVCVRCGFLMQFHETKLFALAAERTAVDAHAE